MTSAVLLLTVAVTPAAQADPLDLVHDFAAGAGGFFAYGPGVTSGIEDGQFCAVVPAHSGNPWDIAIGHNAVGLEDGVEYTLAFTAHSTSDVDIRAQVGVNAPPYETISATNVTTTATPAQFEHAFTSTMTVPAADDGGQVAFQIGNQGKAFTLCLDDVALTSAQNLIPNGDFATGEAAPWFTAGAFGTPDLSTGALCVGVPAGSGIYDGVGFNGLAVEEGRTYVLTYTAWTSAPRTIRTIIGENGGSYRTVVDDNPALTAEPQTVTTTFQSPLSFPAVTTEGGPYEGQLAFQVGGRGEAYTFCLDGVSLVESATPPPPYEPETGPRVRVNQVGYLPQGPKEATLVTDATDPVAWELQRDGVTVESGMTMPAGVDPTAGLDVHEIAFSGVTEEGTYTLVADGDTSYEFVIDADIYQQLRYDALDYFYLARSGIEIDGAVVGDEEYSRPAGHVENAESALVDSSPNQGDYGVECLTDEIETGPWSYGDWTCDYTLDVVGGWYDAGDHGKYVVNGGISAAQVMGTYERTLYSPTADGADLGDGSLDIPLDEGGNGVPDPLDEARWELEFMMSMMVPQGEPLAGMVHHKIHDVGWTGLPLLPHLDPQERRLHRPSTAATLNFAATAAQGARLWAEYDPAFAAELLAAGLVAWEAAQANPELYAPADMGGNGGGPYNDDNVGDEFYWAAAELFLTTGEQRFADHVLASEYHTADIWTPSGITWGDTAGMGRLQLATVESDIPDREAIRQSVVQGAEKYLAWQSEQPFGTTYPGLDGRYEWGSNSMVLNNQIVLGTAYDLTGDQRFADAVIEAMDYLLGRNALNNSYITGYGDVFSQNQHSRWFADSIAPELPNPPAGSVAGGPNSTTTSWDPVMQGLYDAEHMCAPQRCYIDDIQSWSTNEITVNWNSALSWVASFVADLQAGERLDAGSVVRVVEHPADVTAPIGTKASFTASADGDPAPSVQWQRLVDGAWVDVEGADEASLTVVASRVDDGARFRAFFANAFGGSYTDAATLTVTDRAKAPKLTLVYVYQKVDPERRPSWSNSGPQTLVAVNDGHAWVRSLDVADLPEEVCGPGWAVQTDLTRDLERDDVPTHINRLTWTNVLGWGEVVTAARHHSLEYHLGGPVPACETEAAPAG